MIYSKNAILISAMAAAAAELPDNFDSEVVVLWQSENGASKDEYEWGATAG